MQVYTPLKYQYVLRMNESCFILRVVHVAPVYEVVHVQVFGPVHVPLFWHGDVQTTREKKGVHPSSNDLLHG